MIDFTGANNHIKGILIGSSKDVKKVIPTIFGGEIELALIIEEEVTGPIDDLVRDE